MCIIGALKLAANIHKTLETQHICVYYLITFNGVAVYLCMIEDVNIGKKIRGTIAEKGISQAQL